MISFIDRIHYFVKFKTKIKNFEKLISIIFKFIIERYTLDIKK